ncbi:MAG: PLDc N-terminal domain-containing protein [Lactovum sp.]
MDSKLFLLIIPIALIQFGLMFYSLFHLLKSPKTQYFNKIIWGFIICVINLIGPILYLILEGKNESY